MEKISLNIPRWTVEEELGYTPITTFWQDFSVADIFGPAAVADTYSRAFPEWRGNYKYLTELVMVLNHKMWQHHNPEDENEMAFCKMYYRLWQEADAWAFDNLKDEELDYFIQTLD